MKKSGQSLVHLFDLYQEMHFRYKQNSHKIK
jgi:hypothetical protein